MQPEKALYAPVKAYLEGQGYTVKSEIGACDVVGIRDGEPPVVVELKTRFNLDLVLQAVDRLSVSDCVYVAISDSHGAALKRHRRRILKLCRMLGIGLLVVRVGRSGRQSVIPVLDPAPYRPRRNARKRGRLLKEFSDRVGDPNTGGVNRTSIVTAYRQDTLRLLHALHAGAELPLAALRERTAVETAGPILQRNFYGWFERVRRGTYRLSPRGRDALVAYAREIEALTGDRQA